MKNFCLWSWRKLEKRHYHQQIVYVVRLMILVNHLHIYIYIYIYGMFFSKDVQYLLMFQITFKYKGMSLFYLIFICEGKQQIDSAQT